jgi:methionine sulfoxide reductase catalytic subunit
MLIKSEPSWRIRDSEATPESAFWSRRALLAGGAAAGIAGGAGLIAPDTAQAQLFGSGPDADLTRRPDPTDDLYPARRNTAFTLDRPETTEQVAASYNNYYEFGSSKNIWRAAQAKKTRPWTIKIDGLVEKPFEIGVDDLIRRTQLEERLYRFRCVEAWAMAVPWTGFTLKSFLDIAKPLSGAKYVQFETFQNPQVASGQRQSWYPWPYTEAVTIEEAANDLPLMVTGVYGKPLRNQFGAPIRLILPWKYGFKSAKAITRVRFLADRPKSFWEVLQATEYGFWANVNPQVAHPRWSQATESMIGTNERRPTQLFNGYAEQVAHLYKGKESERLFV